MDTKLSLELVDRPEPTNPDSVVNLELADRLEPANLDMDL